MGRLNKITNLEFYFNHITEGRCIVRGVMVECDCRCEKCEWNNSKKVINWLLEAFKGPIDKTKVKIKKCPNCNKQVGIADNYCSWCRSRLL